MKIKIGDIEIDLKGGFELAVKEGSHVIFEHPIRSKITGTVSLVSPIEVVSKEMTFSTDGTIEVAEKEKPIFIPVPQGQTTKKLMEVMPVSQEEALDSATLSELAGLRKEAGQSGIWSLKHSGAITYISKNGKRCYYKVGVEKPDDKTRRNLEVPIVEPEEKVK